MILNLNITNKYYIIIDKNIFKYFYLLLIFAHCYN